MSLLFTKMITYTQMLPRPTLTSTANWSLHYLVVVVVLDQGKNLDNFALLGQFDKYLRQILVLIDHDFVVRDLVGLARMLTGN